MNAMKVKSISIESPEESESTAMTAAPDLPSLNDMKHRREIDHANDVKTLSDGNVIEKFSVESEHLVRARTKRASPSNETETNTVKSDTYQFDFNEARESTYHESSYA
jgi:hypothetical protein